MCLQGTVNVVLDQHMIYSILNITKYAGNKENRYTLFQQSMDCVVVRARWDEVIL